MSHRHRRTRIYGANYEIGERYYKQQLNDLDSKRSDGIDMKKDTFSPKVTFLTEDLDFNNKNSNILKKINSDSNDDDFHIIPERSTYKPEESSVLNELRKTKAHEFKDESFVKQRHYTKFASNDHDFDEDYFGNNSKSFLSRDSVGRHNLEVDLEEKLPSLATLRSKITSERSIRKENISEETEASRRAVDTKARLLDLEEQITSISNKQNEREKRNKDLKKLLSELSSQE